MGMLAFLPWVQVAEPQDIAEFGLVPFRRGLAPAGRGTAEQAIFDGLLAPYHSGGAPIAQATLIRNGGGDLTRELSDEERGALFVFSELLSASGLSEREFFGLGLSYQNRDNFRLVIQGFSGDARGAAITTRRRDGSTMNYWPEGSYRVQKPDHIPLHGRTALDLELFNLLLAYRESNDWEAVYEAILGFNLANTDSSDISEHIEAVLLVGAFERLFDCHHGKEDELAERFSATVVPTAIKGPRTTGASPETLKRFAKSKSVRDMWIRDFFRLRGNLAHGKVESKYQPAWGLRNHLLLGSFVFPLALKLRLHAAGAYELTERDQEAIDIFEEQLLHDHFAPVGDLDDPRAYPWNRVRKETARLRLQRSLAAEIRKNFPDGFGKEGA